MKVKDDAARKFYLICYIYILAQRVGATFGYMKKWATNHIKNMWMQAGSLLCT